MTRARDLGIPLQGTPGPANALTDVPGVEVGTVTIVQDTDDPEVCARTGVTAILPLGRTGVASSCAAGFSCLNGNGEMTGVHWIQETGALSGPVMITNTHAVGPVHAGVIEWAVRHRPDVATEWMLPVVAETWDGYLNSINVPFVSPAHAIEAIESASSGPVPEGNVGGGTGMNCYGFKGGTGTSSRRVDLGTQTFTVGVLCQANFGVREELVISGVPLGDLDVPNPMSDTDWFEQDRRRAAPGAGSVIVVVGTDAPLLPGQCAALARRVPLGLARTGTAGGHFSGDLFLAFSTANAGVLDSGFPEGPPVMRTMTVLPWNAIDPFLVATVQAVEEAVLNALVAAQEMRGRAGHVSHALPHAAVTTRLHRAISSR